MLLLLSETPKNRLLTHFNPIMVHSGVFWVSALVIWLSQDEKYIGPEFAAVLVEEMVEVANSRSPTAAQSSGSSQNGPSVVGVLQPQRKVSPVGHHARVNHTGSLPQGLGGGEGGGGDGGGRGGDGGHGGLGGSGGGSGGLGGGSAAPAGAPATVPATANSTSARTTRAAV